MNESFTSPFAPSFSLPSHAICAVFGEMVRLYMVSNENGRFAPLLGSSGLEVCRTMTQMMTPTPASMSASTHSPMRVRFLFVREGVGVEKVRASSS